MNINCAVVKNNIVINIILMVEGSPLIKEWGVIPVPDNVPVAIGWRYENGEFIDTTPVSPPPTEEQLLAVAEANKAYLITKVEKRIYDLKEATDPDLWEPEEIDPADEAMLKAWRRYLVKLKKASPFNLPEPPEAI